MEFNRLNLFILISLSFFNSILAVNYKNQVVIWERRTLYCEQSSNGITPGHCFLTVGKDSEPKPALCNREIVRNQSDSEELRFSCDIECQDADRDSVISKYPNTNRDCIRFFTYNTKFDESNKRWSIWRTNKCAMDQISLEVHCGFPSEQ